MTDGGDKVKRPASQYYWGDWWKDKGLHSCSLAARGLWHEMNCLMHEGEPYGHLTLNGRPMTVQQLANQCRITPGACKKLLDELLSAGVPSRAESGALFSRRMVRDEKVREARAAGGKAGAEHGIKGAEAGKKGGRPKHAEGGSETPLGATKNPPPSSSSSSSSSPSGIEEGADAPLSPASPATAAALDLTGDAPGIPPCPVKQLVNLFAARVPELPKPRYELWKDSAGAEAMRQRWKWLLSNEAVREDNSRYASTAGEAVEWFGRFFDAVHASDFLSGRNGAWKKCDLGWLMKRENFMKVVQGNYRNEDGARA